MLQHRVCASCVHAIVIDKFAVFCDDWVCVIVIVHVRVRVRVRVLVMWCVCMCAHVCVRFALLRVYETA